MHTNTSKHLQTHQSKKKLNNTQYLWTNDDVNISAKKMGIQSHTQFGRMMTYGT